jgi:hypothetical protein
MARVPAPIDKQYVGRSADKININLSLDREAARLLREFAPTPKSHGRFLADLIFKHAERRGFENLLAMVRKDLRKMVTEAKREFAGNTIGNGKK